MAVKLKWSKECDPDGSCSYNHVWAETPFGIIRIDWKGWKDRPSYDAETPWGPEVISADSLPGAKATIEATWQVKVAECVGEVRCDDCRPLYGQCSGCALKETIKEFGIDQEDLGIRG